MSDLPRGLRVVAAANASPFTLDGTRTYIVGCERPVVIDPGPDDPAHVHAVVTALAGRRPVALLLTHAHPDHAAAAPALRARTGAPIALAPGAHQLPFPTDVVDWTIQPGDRWVTDAGPVEALPTPGHCPDHVAFLWQSDDGPTAFVGDLLLGQGDTTLVAAPEGDVVAYLESLDRLEAARPRWLLPGHGPPMADPAAAIARFRAHRRERVAQVARRLAAGATPDPATLARELYGPLPAPLDRAAAASVEAILRALDAL
jgi:glyoxylase-like metal-dependent hydrolase (beta-lactamase superfamily II)